MTSLSRDCRQGTGSGPHNSNECTRYDQQFTSGLKGYELIEAQLKLLNFKLKLAGMTSGGRLLKLNFRRVRNHHRAITGPSYRYLFLTLSLRHTNLCIHCDGRKRPRDCRIFRRISEPDGPTGFHAQIPLRCGGCDFHRHTVDRGWYDPSNPNEEPSMNIQYSEVMAYPILVVFYSAGRGPSGTDNGLTS